MELESPAPNGALHGLGLPLPTIWARRSRPLTGAASSCAGQIGNVPHLFTVLVGPAPGRVVSPVEYRESLDLAEQCLRIAEELDDPGLCLEAHHAAWGPCYFLGQYEQASLHGARTHAL